MPGEKDIPKTPLPAPVQTPAPPAGPKKRPGGDIIKSRQAPAPKA